MKLNIIVIEMTELGQMYKKYISKFWCCLVCSLKVYQDKAFQIVIENKVNEVVFFLCPDKLLPSDEWESFSKLKEEFLKIADNGFL